MRRIGYAAGALAALGAISFGLALLLVDGEIVREAIGARIEATLGEPVELGAVDLSLFPLPAARIRDARLGDPEKPRLEAREIRVGVSLPALLIGQVVLRSLDLEGPRLILPASGAVPGTGSRVASASRWNAGRAEDVQLAITKLAVHEGTLQIGSERLEQIELSGGLDLMLGASFGFSAEIPGVGKIEEGALEIRGLTGDRAGWSWTASAELEDLDLVALRERLYARGLWGKADGKLSAAGTGLRAERATLELESQDLDVRGALLRLWGPTTLKAEYPAGTVDLDLTQARVGMAQLIEKPPGVALRVCAKEVGLADATLHASELSIESEALRGTGELEIRGGTPALDLNGGSLDLAAFASAWSAPPWLPRSGSVNIERLQLDGEPLALSADASLSAVQVKLPSGLDVNLSGPVFTSGTTVGADALSVEIAGESISTSLRYDWIARRIQLALVAEGARVRPILEKVAGVKDVSGRLYARLELAGPLDPYGLTGKGEFDLVDGAWTGFSLARAAIRVPPEGERVRPDDPPQRIRARVEVDEDELRLIEASIDQDDAQAKLSGLLYLRDLVVDLAGELTVYSPDLPEPTVLPILKVGGTLASMSMSVGNGETEEVRQAESSMVEAFRKAERELRQKEREQRKQTGSSGG